MVTEQKDNFSQEAQAQVKQADCIVLIQHRKHSAIITQQ